jgi:hypothetical protein
MWLSILIVVGLLGGIAAALAGLGPIAIILIAMGVIGFLARAMGAGREGGDSGRVPSGKTMSSTGGVPSTETPQDDETLDKAHVKTGVAHSGQQRMTPDQERLSR